MPKGNPYCFFPLAFKSKAVINPIGYIFKIHPWPKHCTSLPLLTLLLWSHHIILPEVLQKPLSWSSSSLTALLSTLHRVTIFIKTCMCTNVFMCACMCVMGVDKEPGLMLALFAIILVFNEKHQQVHDRGSVSWFWTNEWMH